MVQKLLTCVNILSIYPEQFEPGHHVSSEHTLAIALHVFIGSKVYPYAFARDPSLSAIDS
ncbi:hypothetical protein H5410_059925 [Solanum commersonii]|uniref:Uncharacterized protein n=1 Tax=Solanum commersonii TaxID=4109 RepID=A0A9J5W442_SOLCO|nr:hypothetical protein H5410_059925 [Solanum commersonii]